MINVSKIQKSKDFGLKEYFFKYSPSLQINRWNSVIREFKCGDTVPSDSMFLGQGGDKKSSSEFYFLVKVRFPRHITDIENNIVRIYQELAKHSLEMAVEDLESSTIKELFQTVFISLEEEEWFFSKRSVDINLYESKSIIEIVFRNPESEGNGKLSISRK